MVTATCVIGDPTHPTSHCPYESSGLISSGSILPGGGKGEEKEEKEMGEGGGRERGRKVLERVEVGRRE